MGGAWGPVAGCAAVAAGIRVAEHVRPGPAWSLGVAAVAALVLGQRLPTVRPVALALALLLAGGFVASRAHHGLVDTPLAAAADRRAPLTAAVTLASDPEPREFTARALARLDGRIVLIEAGRRERSPLLVLDAGDRVVVQGRLEPLSDVDARWRWRHAVARLRIFDVLDATPPNSPLWRGANAVRRLVVEGGAPLPAREQGLLRGFLVGDTRALPSETADDFRHAGLAHLLAVSGANVAVVLACVTPLLRRLPLRARLAAGLAVLGMFGAVTRFEPSVLRAVVMAGIGLMAATAGRPVAGLRVLAVAVSGLLLLDPFLLHSVGFGLSCGASAGILLLAPPLRRRLPGPAWLRDVLAATLGAQAGVAPVLLPVFGAMPLVAFPANLAAAPLAAPITVWGLASSLAAGLAAPVAEEVGWLLTRPTLGLLWAVEAVADVAARVPLVVDARQSLGLAAVGALLAAGRASRRLGRDGAPDPPARAPVV